MMEMVGVIGDQKLDLLEFRSDRHRNGYGHTFIRPSIGGLIYPRTDHKARIRTENSKS